MRLHQLHLDGAVGVTEVGLERDIAIIEQAPQSVSDLGHRTSHA